MVINKLDSFCYLLWTKLLFVAGCPLDSSVIYSGQGIIISTDHPNTPLCLPLTLIII